MTGQTARSRRAVYKPLPWQVEPWRDQSPVLLLTGSAGGGKSRLAAEKVHGYLMRYPGATGLMLRKSREFASKSIVPFMHKTVMGGDSDIVHIRKSDSLFEYGNGSILYWGGMRDDTQREAVRSIGSEGRIDIMWYEEANAFSRLDFDEGRGRMRGLAASWQQIILSTNPDAPTHWIYTDLIQGGQAKVYYSGARDNPHNPKSYIGILASLQGILNKRLNLGRWVQAEGAVYDEYDPALHVLDWFETPKDWRRIRSIDFGYTNPFVCQWWAIDPDGRMYLYREIYRTGRLVSEHAADIIRLSSGENIEYTVADHDAEDRATLHVAGVYTLAAKKEVSPGIQAVKQRLAVAGDGKPRLYILRGALVEEDETLKSARKPLCTQDEMPGYQWQEAPDGKPIKEQPLKLNDHGADTARYAVMQEEIPAAVAVDDPFAAW